MAVELRFLLDRLESLGSIEYTKLFFCDHTTRRSQAVILLFIVFYEEYKLWWLVNITKSDHDSFMIQLIEKLKYSVLKPVKFALYELLLSISLWKKQKSCALPCLRNAFSTSLFFFTWCGYFCSLPVHITVAFDDSLNLHVAR